MIELTTLGRSGIRRDGEELSSIARHKQKFAFLTYLAVEKQANRERLLAVFWPEREEERARHSLSQILYALKRELGEECIRVEGDGISADADVCAVDVAALERAAADEDWEIVVQLYGGPFLDQFTLPGAAEFENWQSATRTRLTRLARRGFPDVIADRVSRGDVSGALATAWRWATLEPLEDEAQHALIQLLAQSGDRSGALEQYETYRERLARELEVEPLDDTIALVEAIRAGDATVYRSLADRPSAVAEPEPAYATAEGVPVEAQPDRPLREKLQERRIFHVGAAYLAVAWLAFQFTGTLADRGLLAEWVFPLVLALLTAGLPIALFLAWASEAVPAQLPEATSNWVRRLRFGPVLGVLAVLVVVLAGAILIVTRWLPLQRLEESRVVVFPLTVTPEGNEAAGERAASWIGYTLELTGRFKWVDGWWELDEPQRAGLEDVTPISAREKARSERAAYYIRGRISMANDSVHVFAELHDVRRRTLVERFNVTGPLDETWIPRVSERVAWGLYSALVPAEQQVELTSAADTPQAALEFLDGELAYRNARFSDALQHYQAAVELDSGFALAALKGSMAAGWLHDYGTAQSLINLATRHAAILEPSRAQLLQGLADFLSGRADDAVGHLRSALAADPDYIEAWARLGETYQHLLPNEAPLDSLAESAFVEARRREPEFRPVLYHLLEIAVRNGEIDSARVFLREFERTQPDTSFLAYNELKFACVEQSPQMIEWREAVMDDAGSVYSAGQSLAKAGANTGCARAAWSSLISYATGNAAVSYRFASVMALQSLLAAEGRYDDLVQLWADNEFYDYAGDFYLLISQRQRRCTGFRASADLRRSSPAILRGEHHRSPRALDVGCVGIRARRCRRGEIDGGLACRHSGAQPGPGRPDACRCPRGARDSRRRRLGGRNRQAERPRAHRAAGRLLVSVDHPRRRKDTARQIAPRQRRVRRSGTRRQHPRRPRSPGQRSHLLANQPGDSGTRGPRARRHAAGTAISRPAHQPRASRPDRDPGAVSARLKAKPIHLKLRRPRDAQEMGPQRSANG